VRPVAWTLGVASALLVAACASIVGFPDVPNVDDGGGDEASGADSGAGAAMDAARDSGVDGNRTDSGASIGIDATPDGGTDSAADAGECVPGTTQCAGSAAVEMCDSNGTCTGQACAGSTTSGTSCQTAGDGLTNCGSSSESCCTSLEVPGGKYSRTYMNSGNGPIEEADVASVSGFRLDKYEVTVGRFRQFVITWNGGAGYTPPADSGKHEHLNTKHGLADSSSPGNYESGWLMSDDANITATTPDLTCDPSFATWTASASTHETLPINCVSWWEAYAFCIWDGGFLPSESEGEYAAAGGSLQLEYPWGTTPPGTGNQYAIQGDGDFNCDYPSFEACSSTSNIGPVGTATRGAALWGQLDLGGNVFEWALDWFASYDEPCLDCADLGGGSGGTGSFRVIRDSAFFDPVPATAQRNDNGEDERLYSLGLRCARTP
jgi:formylglycine-generating enzyme